MNGKMRRLQPKSAQAEFREELAAMRATQEEQLRVTQQLQQRNQELEASLSLEGLTDAQCALESQRQMRLAYTASCNYDQMTTPVCNQEFCSKSIPQPLGEEILAALQKVTLIEWKRAEAAMHWANYCRAMLHLDCADEAIEACKELIECNLPQLKECLHDEQLTKVKFVLSICC